MLNVGGQLGEEGGVSEGGRRGGICGLGFRKLGEKVGVGCGKK